MNSIGVPFSLQGLKVAPPQTLGTIRLVPLIRDEYRDDLRLSHRAYADPATPVRIDSRAEYFAYIPHGLIANWTKDGSAVYGTQMHSSSKSDAKERLTTSTGMNKFNRMIKRESKQQLRFLPMHVAMEGLLSLHFGGPSIAWSEYSNFAKSHGLGFRWERVTHGEAIEGLADALRVFEIHNNQCGVLLFVAGALASAFIVPHPEDYLALHKTLLNDFYSELFEQPLFDDGSWEDAVRPEPITGEAINSLAELEGAVDRLRTRWSDLSRTMSMKILNRPIQRKRLYRFASFSMEHFISELKPSEENHIGELIVSQDGAIQYAKTYRLSAGQTRRAYLLSRLAEHQWNIEACAASENGTHGEFCLRLEKAGFGYLLMQHVLDAARAANKKKQ